MPPKDLDHLFDYWMGIAENQDHLTNLIFRSNQHHLSGLFHAHLSMEAFLKACIVHAIKEHAPYSHKLPYLAGKLPVELSEQKLDLLTQLNKYNIQGRYPEELKNIEDTDPAMAKRLYKKSKDLQKWLKKTLKLK